MTLNDYIVNANTSTPFVTEDYLNGASNDCLKDRELQELLTTHILNNYGSFRLSRYIELRAETDNIYNVVENICVNMYVVCAYKYNGLFDTTKLTYNPIENYSMQESGLDSRNTSNSNTIGEQNFTDNIGARTGTDTTTEKVAPYDSEEFSNQSQSTMNTQSNGYTDTKIVGGRSDSNTLEETTNHTFSRSGNIGVTTSQMMIESERQVKLFNFIDVVAKDILSRLCVRIYDDGEED